MSEQMREALRKAVQLAAIASDWNLDEVEIDGQMVGIYDLKAEFEKALEQAEPRGEVVASVKDSLTVRAAFEAWLAWWSTLPNDRDKHGYCDMTVEMLSHAYAAGMTRSAQVGQRGEAVPIKQFRVKGGASWNDGLPPTDHYETRTLYTAPPVPALPAEPDAAQQVEYCWSRDEEGPFAGPHDCAEEAALEALTGTDYDGVYIGERADIDFDGLVDEDSLIETMMCRAGDEVGEVAEDWLSAITQADRNALKAAILPIIKAWVDERDPIRFWRVVSVSYVNREDVLDADQLDDDAEPEASHAPR